MLFRSVWDARGRRNPDLVYPGDKFPARHPVVVTHPRSGDQALYVGSFVSGFVDRRSELRMDDVEARELLQALFQHAVQPERIYRHQWQVGDLVIFDTVGTIHRRETFARNELRTMRQLSTLFS